MTYIAQNVSIDELAETGCDVFSEIKRRKVEYNAYDEDDAMQSLLVTWNQSKLHLFFFCHKCRSLTNGWQAGGRHRSE